MKQKEVHWRLSKLKRNERKDGKMAHIHAYKKMYRLKTKEFGMDLVIIDLNR